jgi:hypothetical protein
MSTRLHDLQRQLFELYRQERYGEALELVTASLVLLMEAAATVENAMRFVLA